MWWLSISVRRFSDRRNVLEDSTSSILLQQSAEESGIANRSGGCCKPATSWSRSLSRANSTHDSQPMRCQSHHRRHLAGGFHVKLQTRTAPAVLKLNKAPVLSWPAAFLKLSLAAPLIRSHPLSLQPNLSLPLLNSIVLLSWIVRFFHCL